VNKLLLCYCYVKIEHFGLLFFFWNCFLWLNITNNKKDKMSLSYTVSDSRTQLPFFVLCVKYAVHESKYQA